MSLTEDELRTIGARPPEPDPHAAEQAAAFMERVKESMGAPLVLKESWQREIAEFKEAHAAAGLRALGSLHRHVTSLLGCDPDDVQSIEYRPRDGQVNVLMSPRADVIDITIVKAPMEPVIPEPPVPRVPMPASREQVLNGLPCRICHHNPCHPDCPRPHTEPQERD